MIWADGFIRLPFDALSLKVTVPTSGLEWGIWDSKQR